MKKDPFDTVRVQWNQERPDLDTSGVEVLWRISFLHRELRRAAGKRLSRLDLPNWAFEVLASLRRQGPPYQMTPSELCEATMITSGAMTNRLDRLEEMNLVERRLDQEDRRSLSVHLTAKGKDVIDRAAKVRFEHANQALAPLSESERVQLVDLLRKLVTSRIMP